MSFIHGSSEKHDQLHPRARFPPVINSIEFIGEVREDDWSRYPRNIGCSSILGGIPLFLFGDTFQEQPNSQYLGVASSTASLGSFSNPLYTRYPSCAPGNKEDGESCSIQFIPFTDNEEEFNFSTEDSENPCDRYYLWTLNAVIEIPGQPGVGVVWFIKGRTNDGSPEGDEFCGVGVAEVEMKQVGVIGAEFAEDVPVARRHGDVIFDNSGPQWGNVATLLDGDYIYLYGTHHHHHHRRRRNMRRKAGNDVVGFVEDPVFVCRVPHTDQSYLFPERYTYWDGEIFSPAPSSGVFKYRGPHLEPVLFNILSGTVFHTTLFSDTQDGLFLMVGCDGSGDGKVRFKISENPWGPWRGEGWLLDLETEDRGYRGVKTCVYAHLWASDLERGELVLSWSEPWPGGIEMVRIGFEMMGDHQVDDEEDGERTVISAETDSMFSDVEERLMNAIGGQHSFQDGKLVNNDVSPISEERERIEARKRALAKLSGNVGSEDLQGYLNDYEAYQRHFDSGCSVEPSSLEMWKFNPFGDEVPDSAVFTGQINHYQCIGIEDRSKSFDRESFDHLDGNSQNEEIKTQPTGRGMRRLTGLFRGTWFAEPYGGEINPKSVEGSIQCDENKTWYDDDSNHEEDKNGEENRSQAMISDASVKAQFGAATSNRNSFFQPLGMRKANLSRKPSPRNDDIDCGFGDSGESGIEESATIGERRRRMKWGAGLKVDVSTVSKRNKRPPPRALQIPIARRSRASVASLDPDWVPIRVSQQPQPVSQQDDQRTSSHWQTHNRDVGPLATTADEKMGMNVLVPGGKREYPGGGYVMDPHGIHTQPPRRSPENWNESKGTSETGSQQPDPESPASGKAKNWLLAIKGSMQKLVQKNLKQADGIADKPVLGLCKGLKKKFSEISLPRPGKSVVNLRKMGKSEANLRRTAEEDEAAMRRFVEEQFDAGN